MRVAPLLLMVLFLPALSAQGDPGERPALEMDARVTAIDIADENGLIGIGTQDPGSRVSVPPNANADTWFIYSRNGQSLMQEGKLDPPSCDGGLPTDDCQTHIIDVAIDQSGQRMVVVAMGDDGRGLVLFVDRTSGPVQQFLLPQNTGTITDVAMNDAGTSVAVVTALSPTGTGDRGRIFYYSWTGTAPSSVWNDATLEGATDVAISPDGTSIAVAAGGDHYRWSSSGATSEVRDTNFPGVANDVAVSRSTRHVSIAASGDGWFQVYDDTTTAGQRELRARDDDTALVSVAIRPDGTAIAVGNSAGGLWVYALNPDIPQLGGLLGNFDLDASITDLEFSADGLTLAVAEGTKVRQYAVNATAVAALWSKDLGAGALGKVSLDRTGSLVASAVGDEVRLFDARHQVTVTAPAISDIDPAETRTLDVTYRNTGNRMEHLEFEVDGPDGWTVAIDRDEAEVAPGKNVTVAITVTAPAFQAPGTHTLVLEHDLASDAIAGIDTEVKLRVPSNAAWSIEPVGADSKNIASGGEVSFTVKISNLGNVAGTPDLDLDVNKAGWEAVFSNEPGSMQPGQVSEFAVQMTAPATAASGDSATAKVTFPGATGSPVSLSATVDALFGVEVTATPSKLSLTPDNETTVSIVIRNTGNAPDSYRIELEVGDDWSASFEEGGASATIRDMAAGASETIHVTVRASDDDRDETARLDITAASIADPSKVATDFVDLSMEEPEEEVDEENGGKDSPFPPLAWLLGALLVAMYLKRRA